MAKTYVQTAAARSVHTDAPIPAKPGPVAAVLLSDLNLLRCFAGLGIPTVVASSDPRDPTFYSRYCCHKELMAPVSNSEGMLEGLLALGRRFPSQPVLFYGDDATLLLVSRNRDRLAPHYRFLLPDPDRVEDFVDKTRFARLANRLGLPIPRTVVADDARTPGAVTEHLSLPCILKPNHHIGWFQSQAVVEEGGHPRKVLLATSPDQLRRMYALMRQFSDAFVVQEYVPGDVDAVYSFHAYVDRHSRVLGYYVGRKIRTYPRESGMSTFLELVKEPEVVEAGLDILTALRFVGVVKIDFKRDVRSGRLYLLELNPRFNLWHYLGAACGVNLPALAYADLIGGPRRPRFDYTTTTRWLSFANDARTFVRDYRRNGLLSWSEWLSSLGGEKVYDVFSWRDPLPFVVGLWQYAKALSAKAGRRVFT